MSAFRETVGAVLRNMLRPVARLALRYGYQLNDLVELLKGVLVDEAERSLRKGSETPSASRISAMSGVHRKDISRLSKREKPTRERANLIGRVMVQWQHDPRFATKGRKPRVLSCEGRESEFASLVESVTGGDLSGYAVLFEMERMGVVEKVGKRVRLLWRDFAPSADLVQQLQQWGEDVYDLSGAVEENLFGQAPIKNHHLKTIFDNIAISSVPVIRDWLMEEGSLFHRRARHFLAQHDIDLNPTLRGTEGGRRVVLGSFGMVNSSEPKFEGREDI